MMHVRTMGLVVDSTARGELPVAVPRVCERWRPDPGTLKYFRSSNTHVLRFERQGEGRFLRLTPASHRERSAVLGELDFVQHLAGQGVPVAVPQRSESGVLVEDVAIAGEPHYAVVFSELMGRHVEITGEDPAVVRAWGRDMGRLHVASRGFVPGPGSTIRSWQDDLRQIDAWLPATETEARRELAELDAWLRGLPHDESRLGMIHFDFEEDNLFWDETRFHVCDFECAARYWYAADVAFALHGLRHTPPERRCCLLAWFLEGYEESAALDRGCEDWITGFMRFCSVYHFAKMCAAYHGTCPADDPEWLVGLRRRHDAWFDTMRRSFHEPWQW